MYLKAYLHISMRWVGILIIFFLVPKATILGQVKGRANIVVAANMKPAMDSIIAVYEAVNPGLDIHVIYGSSGKLYEQIRSGAPFDLFFSADMNFPNKLRDNKMAISEVIPFVVGRLAIWSKKFDPSKSGINCLLDAGIKKISIAQPSTAPYGTRAIECLQYYKLYERLKPSLVYGENIAQAAQFVAFGAADAGIIALSECLSPKLLKEGGKYWTIPQESHHPILQGCVLLKPAANNQVAAKFFKFISSDVSKKIFIHFGYSLP